MDGLKLALGRIMALARVYADPPSSRPVVLIMYHGAVATTSVRIVLEVPDQQSIGPATRKPEQGSNSNTKGHGPWADSTVFQVKKAID